MKNKIVRVFILSGLIFALTGCSNSKAPVIEYQSDGRVHVISDATFNNDELKYYMFCVNEEKNSESCNWKRALSDSVDVVREGNWYFYFKGISNDGKESPISNYVYVEKSKED